MVTYNFLCAELLVSAILEMDLAAASAEAMIGVCYETVMTPWRRVILEMYDTVHGTFSTTHSENIMVDESL